MAPSIQLVVLVLAFIQAFQPSSCKGCKEEERQALLTFKRSLQDPGNRLSSWVGEHCCQWRGVGCDNGTGHIIELDLHNPYAFNIDEYSPYNRRSLGGEINPSLLQLKHLQYLDLSMNNFEGISVPEFISSLENLRHLNLSNAGFGGTIPHSLGNLTNLLVLSLFLHLDPRYFLLPELSVDNFQWLSHLRSLEHLDLRKVNLREADDWLHVMNTLPSLSELRLSSCRLNNIPTLTSVNFTSLTVLDLALNSFNSTIPSWLFNISRLVHLDLRSNQFRGQIPDLFGKVPSLELVDLSSNGYINGELPVTLGSLCKLRSLDLSKNNISGDILEFIESSSGCIEDSLQLLDLSGNRLHGYLPNALGRFQNLKLVGLGSNLFTGPIPSSLGRLSALQVLHLTGNKLSGNVPESLGQLSELVELRIASNMLQGTLSEAHFSNLTKLEFLFLSNNSLALNFRVGWVPPFQLKYIHLGSCQVGPLFPLWLRTQKGVVRLDMSNASISDHMPDWFWESSPHISYLDLSDNQIKGKMPRSLKFKALSEIVLKSNLFEGPLPHFSSNVIYVDLSNNFFSGPIHPRVGKMLPRLQLLSLSSNLINGSIPLSLCKINTLIALDLSKNQLSGQLPHCMWESSEFAALDFSNNNLSGAIPSSMGSLVSLESLHLGNNSLSGELPLSLQNCTELVTLDLGGNGISGRIPPWIGESMSHLVILRLRSNMFSGGIPPQLSHLTSLQVLDLGQNNLSGTIPNSFNNFSAMAADSKELKPIINSIGLYKERLLAATKGMELEYSTTLSLLTSIDLSSNNLSGGIPEGLMSLFGLRMLNVSKNLLSGRIPKKIGGLRLLESLDFSNNMLVGPIPPSMSALTFLSHLNLSYNNLSGRIPSGNQLQALNDRSIYVGNRDLCGPPLTENCPGDEPAARGPELGGVDGEEDEDGFEMYWLYISMSLGFAVGFWSFLGILLIKKSWRHSYFLFFDTMKDRFFVAIVLMFRRLKMERD